MAKQEVKEPQPQAPKTASPAVASHPIVSAYLALRDALQSAMADAKEGGHDNTMAAGEVLTALLAAGGRLPDLNGHAFRHLLAPRGVSQTAADPECSRLAGDVAVFLGGCLTFGVKAIAEGDVNLPTQQRLASTLSKSREWKDAAPVLEAALRADGDKRRALEEKAHWERLGAAKEAALKAKAAGPKTVGPTPLPPEEPIPVS